jgi:hypothetical protein
VVVTLWAIWHARRKAIHETMFQSPLSTHKFVDRFVLELNLLNTQPSEKGARGSGAPRWIAPPAGLMKINVDAAMAKNSGVVSMAAVARDSAGLFMGASAVVSRDITDPETLEVLACREGLALASDLLLQRLVVTIQNFLM